MFDIGSIRGIEDPEDLMEFLQAEGSNSGFAKIFEAFFDIEHSEDEAKVLFRKITDHIRGLENKLGRNVGFRVGGLDYLLHGEVLLQQPVVAEYEKLTKLRAECVQDPLTRLLNRRHFTLTADKELKRSKRYGYPFSLIFIDLDDFKKVNDSYGHAVGDEVLKATAEILRGGLRTEDSAARIGGEEFVMLLPQTALSGARTIGDRLLSSFHRYTFPENLPTTFSGGIATFPRHGDSLDELLAFADRGLYDAKMCGKNRIVVIQDGRREAHRYASVMPLSFEVGRGDVRSGTVTNLSLSGLTMETEWEPKEGEEINLRFSVGNDERMYKLNAHIVWTTRLGNTSRYSFGVRYAVEDDPSLVKTLTTMPKP